MNALSRERLEVAAGAPVTMFDVVASTMELALAAATRDAVHGTTFIAGSQTGGRGRRGRHWASPPGHLYLSMVWRMRLSAADAPVATLEAGVAVAEAVESLTGLEVELKWPNDLLLQGSKCCGILASLASAETPGSTIVVIGVGLNVATLGAEHTNLPTATSLADACGRAFPLLDVAERVIERLVDRGSLLSSHGFDREAWLRRSRLIGRSVGVTPPNGPEWFGVVSGLAPSGELVVDQEGRGTSVVAGDIRLMPLEARP